jgi:hypothetical protein
MNEADRLRTWNALHQSYKRYAACDDGAIAEGYSESVGSILSNHWETLPRLASLSNSDHSFKKFVLRHLDATLDTAQLKKIRVSAIHHCAAEQQPLCEQIKNAAEKELIENGVKP